jgi:hypothetical protein
VVQALVRACPAYTGTGEEGSGAIPTGDLGGQSGLAETSVGHDPHIAAGMLHPELCELRKEKCTPDKPTGGVSDQFAKLIVDIILQPRIALGNGLVDHVVVACDENAVDGISADRNRSFTLSHALCYKVPARGTQALDCFQQGLGFLEWEFTPGRLFQPGDQVFI